MHPLLSISSTIQYKLFVASHRHQVPGAQPFKNAVKALVSCGIFSLPLRSPTWAVPERRCTTCDSQDRAFLLPLGGLLYPKGAHFHDIIKRGYSVNLAVGPRYSLYICDQ